MSSGSAIVKYLSWFQSRTIVAVLCFLLFTTLVYTINTVRLDNILIRSDTRRIRSLPHHEAENPNVCQTAGCVEAAASMISSIDASVHPCDDFYQFSCGQFVENTQIPDDKVTMNSFSLVQDRLQLQLLTILAEEHPLNESRPFVLAKNLYQSCLNKSIIDERGLLPLKELINSYGGWPVVDADVWSTRQEDWDWKNVTKQFRHDGFEINQIFAFSVSPDLTNTSFRTIEFDQPKLGLNREYIIRGLGDKVVKAYYEYMTETAVTWGAEENDAKKEMYDALAFETALAEISLASEDRRNISQMNNPLNIKEIQERYPYINWLTYSNSMMPEGLVLEENEIVSVTEPSFFASLGDLLNRTPKRTMANYMMWRIALYAARFMTTELRAGRIKFLAAITGQQVDEPRWKECIEYTSSKIPLSVGALYVRKYFGDDSRREASEMVNNIRKEFESLVVKLPWMDDATKKAAIDKAKALAEHIGYPNELADNGKLEEYYALLEIERDNWLMNALRLRKFKTDLGHYKLREAVNKTDWQDHSKIAIVNAFYSPLENSIQIPAGILQYKFFNVERPRYMNYAAVGSVVGHEITHGFDDLGRQFDGNGNLVEWWGEETRNRFLVRAQCIIEQYGNYTEPKTQLKLKGITTQGENIADNGGIKESYEAYKLWASKNGAEGTLPGLTYTVEQLFWISSAQMWCSVDRDEYTNLRITTDSHSPNQFRVNGPLSNLKAFSNDFNCPLGSFMNPVHKCEVW